jgi:hypothetical protein
LAAAETAGLAALGLVAFEAKICLIKYLDGFSQLVDADAALRAK